MLSTTEVLAANNFGDTRTGGLAGPMGLFLLIALAIATVLLIRNMNARLRRLPDRFPGQADRAAGQPDRFAESGRSDRTGQVSPADRVVVPDSGAVAGGGTDRGESASGGR